MYRKYVLFSWICGLVAIDSDGIGDPCIAESLLREPPNFHVFYIVCVWGGARVVKLARCFRVECQMASKFYILGGGVG